MHRGGYASAPVGAGPHRGPAPLVGGRSAGYLAKPSIADNAANRPSRGSSPVGKSSCKHELSRPSRQTRPGETPIPTAKQARSSWALEPAGCMDERIRQRTLWTSWNLDALPRELSPHITPPKYIPFQEKTQVGGRGKTPPVWRGRLELPYGFGLGAGAGLLSACARSVFSAYSRMESRGSPCSS